MLLIASVVQVYHKPIHAVYNMIYRNALACYACHITKSLERLVLASAMHRKEVHSAHSTTDKQISVTKGYDDYSLYTILHYTIMYTTEM